MSRKLKNLVGRKFNRLLVVRKAGNTKWGNAKWFCKCDCGNERIVQAGNLRGGNSQSCGCLNKERSAENLRGIASANVGSKNPAWKGGVTPLLTRLRNSNKYANWRRAVFERDNYTCVWCGDKNYVGRGKTVVLNADHIKPFSLYPNLRFDTKNGRTLCVPCHKKTLTFGGNIISYEKKVECFSKS